MRLAGGFVFLLIGVLILPDELALSATAGAGSGCQRRCGGGMVVPYPFGFSGGCPIKLACVYAGNSTAALILEAAGGNATAAAEPSESSSYPYTVFGGSFNSTTSTFAVSLPPACNRAVPGARRWLSGANYGVSSRTGLFLRGGCLQNNSSSNNATAVSVSRCNVPADVVSKMLRTAQCGGGNETTAANSLTCVTSLSPEDRAAAAGLGLFARWEKVEEARCDDLVTSAVYAETQDGTASLEFGVAQLGWWVNGNCSHGGGDMAGRCAANATCLDVQTPSGGWGHRCSCKYGMTGDGFAAGDGCRFPVAGSGCQRRCGRLDVPYPFGFSGTCPIMLSCVDADGNSTVALLRPINATAADQNSSSSYTVIPFNSANSAFVVSLPPSCGRGVADARRWLSGTNYGVSSHSGLFVRGCRNGTTTNCTIPLEAISSMLRTAECGGGGNETTVSSVTCVATISTEAARANGMGLLFAQWDKVDELGCDKLLTSVYGQPRDDNGFSLEFAMADMGWWVNGSCSTNHTAGERCAGNATCVPVQTPSGGWGHRCKCLPGMVGDGFDAGEGCHFPAKKNTKKILIIVGGVLAGTVAAGVLLLCCARCRRSSAAGRRGFDRLAAKRLLSEAASSSGVPVYTYHEVARATNSFSHTHRLGTGAYGTVYVGKLPSPSPSPSPSLVAIKRLRRRLHDDGEDDATIAVLLNEVKLISSVSHPNLVRLLGCCLDRGEQILVYEFVPNGTLSHHLAAGDLPWRARLGIAAETATAIAYLHAKRPPILHRDVKSSNILLDGDLRPKLADFGLSRAVGRGLEASVSHVSTAPQGTPGYLDPEYHQNFHLSDKSDVYSFGVVLLELITAMKVVDFGRPAAEVNLASMALDRIGKGRVDDIVDPALVDRGDEWVMLSVRHVSELAFRCLAFQKDVRPCMSEVAAELRRIRNAAPASVPTGGQTGVSRPMTVDVGFDGVDATVAAVKKAGGSPVSVQDVWVSDQSSPSTNGSMPRFA